MKSLDLRSDVLALKCIKNHILIGIGCTLYIINRIDYEIKVKENAIHPDNIHGIATNSDKLIVYGGKSLCIFSFEIIEDLVKIERLGNVHCFDDWIIDLKCWGSSFELSLKILFAHNNVHNYNCYSKEFVNTACEENCLLYAGSIFEQDCENTIIFSGTVFQEILIWKIKQNLIGKNSQVLYRLKGHKGVIFSVIYNPLHSLICSTSDDRTVRIWKLSHTLIENEKNIICENTEISLQSSMYGHLARVWKAILLKDIIASIGEDSRICFWSLSGELLHKIEAHKGSPIWCIDISEDDVIFTGGADGSVNSWPLSSIRNHIQKYTLLCENKESIPKYVFFCISDILIYLHSKDSNKILQFSNEYKLIYTYDLPKCSSTYCVVELSPNRQCLALASIEGEITLYKKLSLWEHSGQYKITNSKILSMQWLAIDIILISTIEGILYVVKLVLEGYKVLSEHILPYSRQRWVTASCIHDNLLICGDRMGSIFTYNLKNNCKYPLQTFKKIHGRLGVQSCTILKSNLVTTGRDGILRFYKFCNIASEKPSIEFLYKKSMPMDWVSQLLQNKNDYYILGFKEEDFVIYDDFLKRILVKVSCGGAHRSWDCIIYNKIVKFIYIQKKKIYVVTIPLENLCIPPLMTGFYTKQLRCAQVLSTLSNHHSILISGGEDCTLQLHYINSLISESEVNPKYINVFDGHLSSIKCISVLTLVENNNFIKHLVFSGGGRAQLKIWELTIQYTEDKFSEKNIILKDLLSYMLHGQDNERNKIWINKELMYKISPETRYMDLSTMRNPENEFQIFIFIACSDGFLRVIAYNMTSNTVNLINTIPHNNRCILKVYAFTHQEKMLLMTMATDGLLNFWKISVKSETMLIHKILIDGKESFRLHQSGINSFDLKLLSSTEYILVTGGDDNLLNVLVFKIILQGEDSILIQTISSCNSTTAHYAQITGVKLLEDNRIVSVGADQKLVQHIHSFNNLQISLLFLNEKTLCISDIQGLAFFKNFKSNVEYYCIYGNGLQLLKN